MQYLSNRYEKGKKAVQDFMDSHHTHASYKQIILAQGDIVQKQASLGKSAFLDSEDNTSNAHCLFFGF